MSFQKQKITKIVIISLLIFLPVFVQARGLVPCGGDGERRCGVEDTFVLIARVTNWLIAMSGLYAVYQIISAGLWLILSFGNEEAITTKKKAISNAVIGMTMALMAFMFVNTIVNAQLLRIGDTGKKQCALDLKNPLTYLKIDPNQCSSTK